MNETSFKHYFLFQAVFLIFYICLFCSLLEVTTAEGSRENPGKKKKQTCSPMQLHAAGSVINKDKVLLQGS